MFSLILLVFSPILFIFSLILFAFSHILYIFSLICIQSHLIYIFSLIYQYSVTSYLYSVSSYLYLVTSYICSVWSYFIQSSVLYSLSHTVREDIVPHILSCSRSRNNQIELRKREIQKMQKYRNRILISNKNIVEKNKYGKRWKKYILYNSIYFIGGTVKLHTDDIVSKSVAQ